jgi:hypothetical protein
VWVSKQKFIPKTQGKIKMETTVVILTEAFEIER